LSGVPGGKRFALEKMTGRLRYLRERMLNFLCIIHWKSGARAPTRKKRRTP
jgi:hypothetical protein